MAVVMLVVCGGQAGLAAETGAGVGLPAIEVPYQRYVLANGLTLIVHEDHKSPIVSVSAWYRVGGRDEAAGKTGLAHLFEHINFTEDYQRIMDEVGGSGLNASTRNDYTNYYQVVPASALEVALWAEATRRLPGRDSYLAARLAVERGIVKGEKAFTAARVPNVDRESEIIWRNTYPKEHPYFNSGLGTDAELDGITLDDVKAWASRYQGAANIVLVVAGDVQADPVKTSVERWFGDVEAGPTLPRSEEWIAQMQGDRRMAVPGTGINSPRLLKVWNVPPYMSEDYAFLELAARVLGGGPDSRLHARLVTSDQYATDVSVQINGRQLGSQVRIRVALTAGGNLLEAEQALNDELARFLREGPSEEELQRAVMDSYVQAAQTLERIDANGGKSYYLALGELYGGKADHFARALDWKRGATRQQVRAASQRWLASGTFVLAVEPERHATSLAMDAASMPMPKPAIFPPPEWVPAEVQRATLSNGLKLVLAERHGAPVVRMSMRFDAGYGAEESGKSGVADLAAGMLEEAGSASTQTPFSVRAQRLGMNARLDTTPSTTSISFDTFGGRFEEPMSALRDLLENPSLSAPVLERLRRQMAARATIERASPSGAALHQLSQALFPEAPVEARLISAGLDGASLEALTVDDVRDFLRRRIQPDNATLLVVGDTTMATLVPLLEHHLASWKRTRGQDAMTNVPAADAGTTAGREAGVLVIDRPGMREAEIMLGRTAVPRSHPAYDVFALANGLLGERLTERLREARSLTYDVSAQVLPSRGSGALLLRTVVDGGRVADAVDEIRQTLSGMGNGNAPDGREVDLYRNRQILSLPASNETTAGIATTLAEALDFGLDDLYWTHYAERLRSISAADIHDVSRSMLQPEAFTWVIVGDAGRITAQLREVGLESTVAGSDSEGL